MTGERYLIVGLGNPGKEYEGTPHNIGFLVADTLAATYNLKFDGKKANAKLADGLIAGQRVLIAKPQTYMNLSGNAVRGLVDFYQLDLDKILVVADHLDIPIGTLRIRPKGGAGGQKGMRHIQQQLGTQNIAQMRLGIGRPPGSMSPAAYVLRPFRADNLILMQEMVDRALKAIEAWLQYGIEFAMSRYNGTADEVASRFIKKSTPPQPAIPKPPQDENL
jgi:PTH1 family peptidyl-tRNA hydrolase